MSNNLIVGLALLAGGIVLLVMGMNATDSFSESFRHTFTGDYSDKTTWFIVGGIAAIVGGAVMSLLGLGKKLN